MEANNILCIGLVCVDIVFECSDYPLEDSDQSFIKSSLEQQGVDISKCVLYSQSATPTSIVIINKQTGSRTIIHSDKNLPEVSQEDFCRNIDLSQFVWVHFEGRPNLAEFKETLVRISHYNSSQEKHTVTVSLEIEKKTRTDLYELANLVDYLFISKEHCIHQGHMSKEDALKHYTGTLKPRKSIICAWGEDGAAATMDGDIVTSPVYAPDKVVDTLAAGDTFNAAVILSLSRGSDIKTAIQFGCQVAGAKCGLSGLSGLSDIKFNLKL